MLYIGVSLLCGSMSAVERVVPKNPRERVKGVVYVERRCDRLAGAGDLR
jgi:hypothetical protein